MAKAIKKINKQNLSGKSVESRTVEIINAYNILVDRLLDVEKKLSSHDDRLTELEG